MNIVKTAEEAEAFYHDNYTGSGPYGLDCETVGIDPRSEPASGDNGRIVCFTVASEQYTTFFWWNDQVKLVMKPWLESAPVIGHNIYGFDYHMFRKEGVILRNIVGDTLRMHRLLCTAEGVEHGLKALMKWWLNLEPTGSFEQLFSRRRCVGTEHSEAKYTKRKIGDTSGIPTLICGDYSRLGAGTETVPLDEIETNYPQLLPVLYEYACLDATATLRLYEMLCKKMNQTPLLTSTELYGTKHAA